MFKFQTLMGFKEFPSLIWEYATSQTFGYQLENRSTFHGFFLQFSFMFSKEFPTSVALFFSFLWQIFTL
jgi:hypothetical protein